MTKRPLYQTMVYQEGKYYVAQCLGVDVSSFGESEQQALTNLEEAVKLYFENEATGGPKDLASQLDNYLYGNQV